MATTWEELGCRPADPLSTAGWRELRHHLLEPVGERGLNRYLLAASRRDDLRTAFPDPFGESGPALLDWAWAHGVDEGLAPDLLPPPARPLPRSRRLGLALRPIRQAADRTWATGARRLAQVSHEAKLEAIHLLERRLGRPLPGAGQRTIQRALAAAREARNTYRAAPWPGEVVLISSEEFREKSSYLGWEARACGGVRRFELPHGHIEMLREPGVADLAASRPRRESAPHASAPNPHERVGLPPAPPCARSSPTTSTPSWKTCRCGSARTASPSWPSIPRRCISTSATRATSP
jgi:hypothetical protein